MGSKSDTYENHVLQYLLDDAALTRPTVWYIALGTAGSDSAFTELTTANYTNYARVQVNAVGGASPAWSISGSAATNSGEVRFDAGNSASGPTATHFAVMAHATNNAPIYWGALDSSLAILANVIPEFANGAIDITED